MAGGTNTGSAAGHAVVALADRQHGVVSLAQLRGLGVGDKAIEWRVASGWLHRLFRGVYAVGRGDVGRRGRMFAAVLACGEGTVVSHASAAELLGLWDKRPVLVNVIAPDQAGRRIDGIRWPRAPPLKPGETGVCDGIPCTAPARTIVDLAGSLGRESLRRIVEQAAVNRLLDVREVDRALAHGRRRGAPQLRKILTAWRGDDRGGPLLRSLLEARLRPRLIEVNLPRPQCNAVLWIDGERFEVDLLWEKQRVVVETDGEQTHGTRVAFQRDRRRDHILAAAGYRTSRVTWRQMDEESDAVVSRIVRTLVGSGLPVFDTRI
jgi:hypothetical protein